MERRMMVVVCALALIFGLGFAGTVKVAAGEEPTVAQMSSSLCSNNSSESGGKSN